MPMTTDEMVRFWDQYKNGAGQRDLAKGSDYRYDIAPGNYYGGQDAKARARNTELQQRYTGESESGYNSRMDQRFGDMYRKLGLKDYGEGADLVRRVLDGQNGWRTQAREGVLAEDAKNKELDDQIKAFYERMNSDLNPNDPEVRAAMAMGTNTGQRVSRDRGLRGGLSTSGIVQASQNALNPMRQFRQQQALQALNLLSGRNLGQRQLAMGEAGQAREAENERWAKQQALWQMIASGVGTAASVVAAPFTGGATIPGAIAGGAALADGIGKYVWPTAHSDSMVAGSGSKAGWNTAG
jgi:hypothetical protein